MKASMKRAHKELDSGHRTIGRAASKIGLEHGAAMHAGDGGRSRRLSAALGATQRAAEMIRDAQRELRGLDQAQADALPMRGTFKDGVVKAAKEPKPAKPSRRAPRDTKPAKRKAKGSRK